MHIGIYAYFCIYVYIVTCVYEYIYKCIYVFCIRLNLGIIFNDIVEHGDLSEKSRSMGWRGCY